MSTSASALKKQAEGVSKEYMRLMNDSEKDDKKSNNKKDPELDKREKVKRHDTKNSY